MDDDNLSEINLSRRELFESIPLGIVFQDSSGTITAANPAAQRILGLTIEQMRGRHSIDPRWQSIHEDGSPFPGDQHPTMLAIQSGHSVSDVVMGVFNPVIGRHTWLTVTATPLFEADGATVKAAYSIFKDITRQKAAEDALKSANRRLEQFTAKLRRLAKTDALTGLSNRHALQLAMALEFQRFLRFRLPVALVMLDIDHFKLINDRFGHQFGDSALAAMARILACSVRATDLAARFGGEEFVLVMPGASCELASCHAQQIRERLGQLIMEVPGGLLQIKVSAGISCFSTGDSTWQQALQRADQAMYRAKAAGRDCIMVAEPGAGFEAVLPAPRTANGGQPRPAARQ